MELLLELGWNAIFEMLAESFYLRISTAEKLQSISHEVLAFVCDIS
jgi:hypothetical protein